MNIDRLLLIKVFTVIISFCPFEACADMLYLNSGESVEGEIVEYTDQYVKIDNGTGVEITYFEEEIMSIEGRPKNKIDKYSDKVSGQYHQLLIEWLKGSQDLRTGFPVSFSVLPQYKKEIYGRMCGAESVTGIIERMIVEEGVSVYDTAVYQMVLSMLGGKNDLERAYRPVAVYWKGSLGELKNIRAGGEPGQAFIYDTDKREAVSSDLTREGERGFVFRIFNAKGKYNTQDPLDGKTRYDDFPNWPTVHWEDWKPIAGENAWIVLAALQLYHKKYFDPDVGAYKKNNAIELKLAEEIARAAILLQAENGGIRMAPIGTFCNLIGIDNEGDPAYIEKQLNEFAHKQNGHSKDGSAGIVGNMSPLKRWYYYEISSENNISWNAAFRMLYKITGNPIYREAQNRTMEYLRSVWDVDGNVFYQGAHFKEGEWIPNREYFATDVQAWAIVSLGPQRIDELFGEGSSYRIWKKTKEYSGAYNGFGYLSGVGFTKEKDRICIEWTAGAIMATRALAEYYQDINPIWADECQKDSESMRDGIEAFRYKYSENKAAYSYSSKRGWIPFGWFSHEPEVLSLVSTSWVVLVDANYNPFFLH